MELERVEREAADNEIILATGEWDCLEIGSEILDADLAGMAKQVEQATHSTVTFLSNASYV